MTSVARWSVQCAAEAVPERLAVIGSESLTFRELAARVQVTAAALARSGVDFDGARTSEPGRVMMVAPNSLDTICTLLALFERGIPVMLIHPRSTQEERRQLACAYPPSVYLDGPVAPNREASAIGAPPPEIPAARDLAIFFTSGTTGKPKAVRLSRGAFEASAAASADNLGWKDDDRWLVTIPMAHIGGFSILTRCLLARRTVVLHEGRSDPESLHQACERHSVTLLSLVPTMLRRWLPRPAPTTLRAVLIGGAPADPRLLETARAHRWPVLTTYGLTEACSQVTVQSYDAPSSGGDSGVAVKGTEVRVEQGRILVRGPTLLSGYLAAAGGAIPSSPFDSEGWFDTGDVGRMAEDGRLFVEARRQDLILSGGENVYPREVEAALLAHRDVEDAIVFGIEDPEWGQVVCAVVVPFDSAVDLMGLDNDMRAVLAGPKRPRRWALADRFPLTPSGKIDRRRAIEAARVMVRALQ